MFPCLRVLNGSRATTLSARVCHAPHLQGWVLWGTRKWVGFKMNWAGWALCFPSFPIPMFTSPAGTGNGWAGASGASLLTPQDVRQGTPFLPLELCPERSCPHGQSGCVAKLLVSAGCLLGSMPHRGETVPRSATEPEMPRRDSPPTSLPPTLLPPHLSSLGSPG